jgi:hypothetical protein
MSTKRTPLPRLARGESKPAPRPPPMEIHTFTRIDAELDARLRALQPRMSKPWRRATQSDVLRAVILAGLPIIEAAYPPTVDEAPPEDSPPARTPRPSR